MRDWWEYRAKCTDAVGVQREKRTWPPLVERGITRQVEWEKGLEGHGSL